MALILLATLFYLLVLDVKAFGATRYVSKSGSDANGGTSWSDAWLTVNKVNTTVVGGDTVFFGTGIWREQLRPIEGSYADRTTYACSSFALTNGSGQYHFAQFYGSDQLTTWTRIGTGNTYRTNYTPSDVNDNLWQGDSIMYLQVDSASVNSVGKWWAGNGHVVAWVYGGDDPDNYDMEITVIGRGYCVVNTTRSYAQNPTNPGGQDHVTLWGLAVKYGCYYGIGNESDYPRGYDSVFIEHCLVNNISGFYGENPAGIYTAKAEDYADEEQTPDAASYNRIRACSLGTCIALYPAPQREDGAHGEAVCVYSWNKSVIDSCVFFGRQTRSQVYLKVSDPTPTGAFAWNEYDTIRYNKFDCTKSGYWDVNSGQTGHDGIFYNFTRGIDIFDKGRHIEIYGNIFISSNSYVSGVDIFNSVAANLGKGYVNIFNNTFYNFAGAFGQGCDEPACTPLLHNQAKYNVFARTSSTSSAANLDSTQFWDSVDSNMYYTSSGSLTWYGNGSSRTWSQWQALGMDVHSSNDVDPGLAADFSRSATGEMNRTYGGKTWTIYGAWQPTAGTTTKRFLVRKPQ